MIADLLRAPGRAMWQLAAKRLLSPALIEQVIYWRAESLYWTGVIYSDIYGGGHEEESEIHASEGAETAIRRFADGLCIVSLPGESLTSAKGIGRLRSRIEMDERAALRTLDRLGPSRSIPLGEYPREYVEAADAELMLDRADKVAEYLGSLSRVDEDHDAGFPLSGDAQG